MKKIASLLLIAIMLLSLVGCGNKKVTGSVSVLDEDGNYILMQEVTLEGNSPKAITAITYVLSKNDIEYTLKDGMLDNINGVASTMEDGWLLYVGDSLAEVGASTLIIEDGFDLELRYVNYAESFNF